MLFALICTDIPDGLPLRMATRGAHLAWLQEHQPALVSAGPMLDERGDPCGSVFILDFSERVEAEAFAANDPYAQVGLFETTRLAGYRAVFRDGKQLG